jgi:hypothetical protein
LHGLTIHIEHRNDYNKGSWMGWPSVPVPVNLYEGYCIAMQQGGITTPERPDAGEEENIFSDGFIVIPVNITAKVNVKITSSKNYLE